MALSIYDKMLLGEADQKRILEITDMWNASTDPTEKAGLHNLAESIRQQKGGYTGDMNSMKDGSGFISVGLKKPELGNYADISDYTSRIDEALSSFTDRDPFSYNADTDPTYQAFLGKVNRMAETTYNDSIAGASVGSGGRPNSWAGTVASQAMGNMMMQGAEAMPQFRDIAYQMYKDEGTLSLQKLEALMGLDQVAYGRYVDQYNSEVDSYKMAVDEKSTNITNALERTKISGFVSNSDAMVLGLPAGTPSFEATTRALDMKDYLEKSKIDLQYRPPSGGGGGGDDTESKYDATFVFNYLKNKFGGTAESMAKAKPVEKGNALYELYKQGGITMEELQYYATEYGAELPAKIYPATPMTSTGAPPEDSSNWTQMDVNNALLRLSSPASALAKAKELLAQGVNPDYIENALARITGE